VDNFFKKEMREFLEIKKLFSFEAGGGESPTYVPM